MAQDLEKLVVQLSADIKQYDNGLKKAQGLTQQRLRAIERETEAKTKGMARQLGASAAKMAAGLAAGFAVTEIVRELGQLSDAATRIDNALKIAGLSGQQLEDTYQGLKQAALENGAPLEALATLYSKAAQSQKELGASSEELKKFSGDVALALRVAQTDATAASGALTQLGQALGSGTVHAEEFGSILEGVPTIAIAAAAGLKEAGGSVARLKQLVVDGKVSSGAFFRAFEAGTPLLRKQAKDALMTISGAFQNLQTAMLDAVRDFNTSTGASERFAGGINAAARAVNAFDVSNLVHKLGEAKAAFDSFLHSAGNASVFQRLNKLFGTIDADGLVVNVDAEKAKDEIAALEKDIERTKKAIDNNVRLDFDNGPAMTRLSELQTKLGQLQAAAAKIPEKVAGYRLRPDGIQPIPIESALGTNGQMGGASRRGGPRGTIKPISLADLPAPVARGGGSGGSSKASADDYKQATQAIRERTAALDAETKAQGALNGTLFTI